MRPTPKQALLAVAMGVVLVAPVDAIQPNVVLTPLARAEAAAPHPLRVSKLIGMSARDRSGEAVGEVKDVVIDTNTGRAHYLVLASGGALGIGEKLHAVPLSRARLDGSRSLALDLAKADLTPSAAFDSSRLPDANVPRVGLQGDRSGDAGQANARYRRASDVLKAKVRDSHGGTIGKVDDLLLDVSGSRVQQVVVKFDRAWNPNDKLLSLPMSSFADGATFSFKAPVASGAAPPRNPPPPLALLNPSGEPTKGTASAVNPPGSVETRPPAAAAARDAPAQPIERQPLKTTTSYADDESLVFKGTREQLRDAPAFDASRMGG